ncbi:unnamed protein product [Closterium sp. Yama58-4]|nr:unnamed protein product [Closterium sp. Yama58-4]
MGLVWRAAKMLDASWHVAWAAGTYKQEEPILSICAVAMNPCAAEQPSAVDASFAPRRIVIDDVLSRRECEELAFIHASSSTVGYRPHVRSTTLAHLIASNCAPLMLPILPIRDRIRDRVEEAFGMQLGLLVEFTGLISWLPGATIGWHADDNRPYLKQRAFAVTRPFLYAHFGSALLLLNCDGTCVCLLFVHQSPHFRSHVSQAVCYLNEYGKDFDGGLFRFRQGHPHTVTPKPGKEGHRGPEEGGNSEVEGGEQQGGSEAEIEEQGEGVVDIRIQELASMGWKDVPFLQTNCNATMQPPPGSDDAGVVQTESEWVVLVPTSREMEKDVAEGKERQGHAAEMCEESMDGSDGQGGPEERGGGARGDSVGEKASVLMTSVVFYNILHALQVAAFHRWLSYPMTEERDRHNCGKCKPYCQCTCEMDEEHGQFLPEVLTEFFRHVYAADAHSQAQPPGSTSEQGGEDGTSLDRVAAPIDSPQGLVRSAGESDAARHPGGEDDMDNADPPAAPAEGSDGPTDVAEVGGEAPGQRKKRKRQSTVGMRAGDLPVTKPAQRLCCGILRLFVQEAVGRATEQAEVEGSTEIEGPHLERILPKLLLDF